MGLNKNSTGHNSIDSGLNIALDTDIVVALAGNPNVGKSTIFNALTGMNQHTGNWPGKTVANAIGYCKVENKKIAFVDIPGCYSLLAHSPEEEIASEYICNANADITLIVCDATNLERNLNFVYQTLEAVNNVIVCINLIDEAYKKGIKIDYNALSEELSVPVIPICARKKKGIKSILKTILEYEKHENSDNIYIKYPENIENLIRTYINENKASRWLAVNQLCKNGMLENFDELIATYTVRKSEETAKKVIRYTKNNYDKRDRFIDQIITSKTFGFPIMFLMLAVVFWLTIIGANYPSEMLSNALFFLEDKFYDFMSFLNFPTFICDMLAHGMFRVLAWVVAVMLPPMAIFFPLFSLLEDLGVLPRIAFNLDRCFKKCSACGKQSLTMCMGFGCNAAGVVGCRIIDSPRERLIAIITNSFVPCNGRFPAMISIISMFLITASYSFTHTVLSSLILSAFIILGILLTLFTSKILSLTVLKGIPSSFTLELPPYRRPQIRRTIISSVFDRTIFVLGRAAAVAAPTGLIIWLMANVTIEGQNLLTIVSSFLDPFGRTLGLDGVIILAFIFGFPANEIVIPIIIMSYLNTGTIVDISDLSQLKSLLVDNGWTIVTAINTIVFSLCHWPCSTTLLTIRKETKSNKWTLISLLIPTLVGIILCLFINFASKLFV